MSTTNPTYNVIIDIADTVTVRDEVGNTAARDVPGHLVAAAPDLLFVLEALKPHLMKIEDKTLVGAALQALRNARGQR